MRHSRRHFQQIYTLILLLVAEETLVARLTRAYSGAFRLVIAYVDEARAEIFVEEGHAARGKVAWVRYSQDGFQIAKSYRLSESPKEWSQDGTRVPKGLGDRETNWSENEYGDRTSS